MIQAPPIRHLFGGRYGYTAIHVAAECGDQEMLDLLLSAQSTQAMTTALTTPASDGQSPLSMAAENGHSAAVSSLLGAGAKRKVFFMGPCALR